MSVRDLLVFLVVLLSLPRSFRQPFTGLLVFSWLAYMRPQDLCWGFARNMRLSFYVGIAMVVGWWASESGRRAFARWDFRSFAMLLLGLLVVSSYAMARHHSAYFDRYLFEFLKILVVALFTTGQVDSRQRFRVMAWTIALCLGFFGVKGGVFGVLSGGAQILRGPGGMMEDNNDFALALVMNVPLLWYLGLAERERPRVRQASQFAVLLTVVTIVLTHSRGAFLALSATALWIAWRSGRLLRAFGALFGLALLFPLVAPQEVLDRLGTIGDTQESSASARLTAWATAFRMIADNPFFGVGLRNFQPRYLEYSVLPPSADQTTYVAHNSYLQIWAESGTLAFAVYMAMLGSVFLACRRVFRIGRSRPDLAWAADYARMMEATTVGFMVGAFFLNRGHFDLVYHWLALVTALVAVAVRAQRELPQGAAVPATGARRITVRWRPAAGGAAAAAGAAPAPRWGRWR